MNSELDTLIEFETYCEDDLSPRSFSRIRSRNVQIRFVGEDVFIYGYGIDLFYPRNEIKRLEVTIR